MYWCIWILVNDLLNMFFKVCPLCCHGLAFVVVSSLLVSALTKASGSSTSSTRGRYGYRWIIHMASSILDIFCSRTQAWVVGRNAAELLRQRQLQASV